MHAELESRKWSTEIAHSLGKGVSFIGLETLKSRVFSLDGRCRYSGKLALLAHTM